MNKLIQFFNWLKEIKILNEIYLFVLQIYGFT